MSETEIVAAQKTAQFFRMRSEGYQALAESCLMAMAERVIIGAEALAALQEQDRQAGHTTQGSGTDNLIRSVRDAMAKVFPQCASMTTVEFVQFAEKMRNGGLL